MAESNIQPFHRAPDLTGDKVRLSHLGIEFVSDRYVDWMNDYEVVKFTESRFSHHTHQTIEQFVRNVESATTSLAWAIFVQSEHIGNIKLGPVNWRHSYADIGVIIGSKAHWGHGYATESLQLVVDWAFRNVHLHKLTSGFYDGNNASVRAFEKAGFSIEARQSSHYYFEGEYIDRLAMAIINPSDASPPNQS